MNILSEKTYYLRKPIEFLLHERNCTNLLEDADKKNTQASSN